MRFNFLEIQVNRVYIAQKKRNQDNCYQTRQVNTRPKSNLAILPVGIIIMLIPLNPGENNPHTSPPPPLHTNQPVIPPFPPPSNSPHALIIKHDNFSPEPCAIFTFQQPRFFQSRGLT